MSKSQKRSKVLHRAAKEDVTPRVWYAFSSGDDANPYELDDKRHLMFANELARTRQIDSDFEDMSAMMGSDTSLLTKRVHPNPGPVVPIDELVAEY